MREWCVTRLVEVLISATQNNTANNTANKPDNLQLVCLYCKENHAAEFVLFIVVLHLHAKVCIHAAAAGIVVVGCCGIDKTSMHMHYHPLPQQCSLLYLQFITKSAVNKSADDSSSCCCWQ